MTSSIKTVAVCGAGGTMGAGIAIVAARAGFSTICFDTAAASLDRAAKQTDGFFAKSVERGKMSAADKDAVMARLSRTTKLEDLAAADLVIEAVFEDLSRQEGSAGQARQGLPRAHDLRLQHLDALHHRDRLRLRSRRSRRRPALLPAGAAHEADRGVARHQHIGRRRSKTAWAWCEAAGQLPVKTQDKPGFILNALLVPFNNDAIRAVEAGVASPADIDTAIKMALGYKMGPLELIDLVGLDTQVRLCEAFYPVTLDPRAAAPPLLTRMVAAGRLGRKSGRGFYAYDSGKMFGG